MKNLRRALLEMQVAHELELSHVYGEIQSLWDAREIVKKFLGGDLAISEVDDLQKENERLRATLDEFFKVVIINGQTYRPSIALCSGCPHLTISRGWECFYKRDTTDCAYPEQVKQKAQ